MTQADEAEGAVAEVSAPGTNSAEKPPGGVESEEEEQSLLALNEWVEGMGLPRGNYLHEVVDADTGNPVALFDLAWPSGLQEGLSQPVAVLLNESKATLEVANAQGFRYFTGVEDFRQYVQAEVRAEDRTEQEAG